RSAFCTTRRPPPSTLFPYTTLFRSYTKSDVTDSSASVANTGRMVFETEMDLDYEPAPLTAWHVIWTRSNCEVLVAEQLRQKRYEVFLPMMTEWKNEAGSPRANRVPMFRSYVFVHHSVGRHQYLDICKTRGVVTLLAPRCDG